ncbi:MAG: hypothetical protein AMS18_08145, partial [Gemmatimonas sp. SG8_17]
MATLEFHPGDLSAPFVLVKSPATEVTIQEIYDGAQDWLDEPVNMSIDHFVEAAGKDLLDAGPPEKRVGVTLRLLHDWRIKFEDRAGPTVEICRISGGNLVTTNSFGNNPIYASDYVFATYEAATSPTIVGVGTPTEIADAVLGETMTELTGDPGATPTFRQIFTLIFMTLRNKSTQDG